jgi:DNA-binding transcriptional LysR family regulator
MPEGDASFEQLPLYPMHLIAVVASAHRFARRRAIEVGELADQVLLLLKPDFASRVWFDAISQVARVKPGRVIESAVPQTLLALARDGHGIAVVPSPVVGPSNGVRAMPLVHHGAAVGRWAVLAWDPRRGLARHMSTFIDELVGTLRHDYPGRALVRRAPPLPRP